MDGGKGAAGEGNGGEVSAELGKGEKHEFLKSPCVVFSFSFCQT